MEAAATGRLLRSRLVGRSPLRSNVGGFVLVWATVGQGEPLAGEARRNSAHSGRIDGREALAPEEVSCYAAAFAGVEPGAD